MKYFTSFGMPILPTKHDDIVMACRTLEAVAWAEENDVSIGVRQSGFREASVRLHGERTFMLGKNYLEAIEALRAKVEPFKLTDEELARLDKEAVVRAKSPAPADQIHSLVGVTPEDAATLAALRECRELGIAHFNEPWRAKGGGRTWRVFKDCHWDVHYGHTLPEALAAYKEAQRPKDLRPTCWCCRKKWPDFPPEGIDAQVYPCQECMQKVQATFQSTGPRCPDKPEGEG